VLETASRSSQTWSKLSCSRCNSLVLCVSDCWLVVNWLSSSALSPSALDLSSDNSSTYRRGHSSVTLPVKVCLERFCVYLTTCCHRYLTYITTSGNGVMSKPQQTEEMDTEDCWEMTTIGPRFDQSGERWPKETEEITTSLKPTTHQKVTCKSHLCIFVQVTFARILAQVTFTTAPWHTWKLKHESCRLKSGVSWALLYFERRFNLTTTTFLWFLM